MVFNLYLTLFTTIVETIQSWGITLPINIGELSEGQSVYLDYHRENVFKGTC